MPNPCYVARAKLKAEVGFPVVMKLGSYLKKPVGELEVLAVELRNSNKAWVMAKLD